MIVNINHVKKTLAEKCSLPDKFFKRLWSSLAFTKVNKYSQTNTDEVNPQHLKVEVEE